MKVEATCSEILMCICHMASFHNTDNSNFLDSFIEPFYTLHSDTLLIACLGTGPCCGFQLTAYLSQSGLHGEVVFQQHPGDKSTVMVQTSLQAIDEQSQWSWMVRERPVFYSHIQDRCDDDKLGSM
jgi:hypothetical protein